MPHDAEWTTASTAKSTEKDTTTSKKSDDQIIIERKEKAAKVRAWNKRFKQLEIHEKFEIEQYEKRLAAEK